MKSYVDSKTTVIYHVADGMEIREHEGNIVTYRYRIGRLHDYVVCEFGLLSEVGEAWRKIFEQFIYQYNLKIEIVDTPDYFGERIVK